MKIICPFCKAELDSKDDVPSIAKRFESEDYVCHKVFCRNVEHHPDHNVVAVVFEVKDEDQKQS